MTEPRWLEGGSAPLELTMDRPTVWWLALDDPATRQRAQSIVPVPGEASVFARHPDAGERLTRRRLARLLLAGVSGRSSSAIVIEHDAHGAPTVREPEGWFLSLAARWPTCLIAVARQPIGVDVERLEEAPVPLDLLTMAERDMMAALPPSDRGRAFAECWAAKEAHAKWTGQPRRVDPATVETLDRDRVASLWGESRCWRRNKGDLIAALCSGPR